MREVLYIDDVERAGLLLKPLRIELLRLMTEPRTCPELGQRLGETPQKIYYHVKVLEHAGLVEKVAERRVGGIMEGLYQAVARSYWLSPKLVGQIGEDGARRTAFLEELRSSVQALAEKYGALSGEERDPQNFRLMIACYPAPIDGE
jgi:DNA-binding transcriptional ArsR family regulator